MEAFNLFIPGNDLDSSIPCAFFDWNICNTTDQTIDYTLAFSCGNAFPEATCNRGIQENGITAIRMSSETIPPDSPLFGDLVVATDSADAWYQEYWFRGAWFDDVTTFWREFSSPGKMQNRHYEQWTQTPGRANVQDMCTLMAGLHLAPGEEGKRLCSQTHLFQRSLQNSSLPAVALDAIQGNLAILKSTTCLRLENGEFWAWEGVNQNAGSCEGSCSHVWNYAYALPFLFPQLERCMRELEYTYNITPTGEMKFRLMLPLGSEQWNFRACAVGQFGGILKFYREWKISGDDDWLRKFWPQVKKSLEYAWSPENPDRWDPDKKGVLTGRQHHTLDVELLGPNSWLTGFYLAALKAAEKIADYLGETDCAEEYRSILRRGQEYLETELFNGDHYIQKVDLSDHSILDRYQDAQDYWNPETGETSTNTAAILKSIRW